MNEQPGLKPETLKTSGLNKEKLSSFAIYKVCRKSLCSFKQLNETERELCTKLPLKFSYGVRL